MSKDEYKNNTAEETTAGSSGLGREAKIGVSVIALLAIIFGVVVVMRLSGSEEEEKVAAATASDDSKDKADHGRKNDALPKESHVKKKFYGSAAPTVVTASTASTKPPKTATHDSDRWNLRADRNQEKSTGGNGAPGAPPSFGADLPKPPIPDRQDRYALDPPGGERSSRRYTRDSERNDSSGFAMAEPTPPAPDPREHSRYGIPPASPSRTGASYTVENERSMPAMSVGQYDARQHQRESPSRGHYGGSRRSDSATLYGNPPPRREDGKYEVQPNDNYWRISETLYGSGAYFKALAQHNRGRDAGEDQLQPGALILAPEIAELEKSYPDLCPKPSRREAMQSQGRSRDSTVGMRNSYQGGRTYTVAEGDTLFDIARYELGKASRWAEIYDLNRDVLGKDFNYLTPGTQLILPGGDKSEVIAEPPSQRFRR